MTQDACSVSAVEGKIEDMLLEVDEKEVWLDGTDYLFLVQVDTRTGRTYYRWTPVGQEKLGKAIEIEHSKVSDALKHPSLYVPATLARVS